VDAILLVYALSCSYDGPMLPDDINYNVLKMGLERS
jgi:hypothetical protein